MNRNELKTIAEGFKKARPTSSGAEYDGWIRAVACVANALQLVDKQRSNFLAACGANHQG